MCFRLDLTTVTQFSEFDNTLKKGMYHWLHEKSTKEGNWVKITGLLVGAISGFLTIAKRCEMIAEAVVKGIINIIFSPCNQKANFWRGVDQIITQAPKNLIALPFVIFSACIKLLMKICQMYGNPYNFTYEKWCQHDPIELEVSTKSKEGGKQAIELFKQQQSEQLKPQKTTITIKEKYQHFLTCQTAIEQNPNDGVSQLMMGIVYRDGLETYLEKNPTLAFKHFMKAAELKKAEAYYFIADCYLRGVGVDVNTSEALSWYHKSAENGIAPSKNVSCFVLATHYDTGIEGCEIELDQVKAELYYTMAAEGGVYGGLIQYARFLLAHNSPDCLLRANQYLHQAYLQDVSNRVPHKTSKAAALLSNLISANPSLQRRYTTQERFDILASSHRETLYTYNPIFSENRDGEQQVE